jgi:V8-like Glu-specific endopeptidase
MSRVPEMPQPLEHEEVAKRRALPARGRAKRAEVTLLDVAAKGLREPRLVRREGRLRVVATVDADGLDRRRRYDLVPVTKAKARDIDPSFLREGVDGHRPAGQRTVFLPKKAKPTHQLRPDRDGEDLDVGGTIFGSDDRYLFDDRSFPWRTTGKVNTVGKWGSGTTIGPRHVLTASHVVNWTGGSGGGVAWLTFTPGYYDGSGPWGAIAATHVIYWLQAPGTLSDQQTAFDYVVLVMEDPIGDIVGYPGYRTYNDDWDGGAYWQYIGYPGELSSGERPAFQGGGVISSVGAQSFSGQDASVLGHFNEFTPGQSGGAVWGWWAGEEWPRVVGVGSTIGSTAVQTPTGSTSGDNEYGGGPALSTLIGWARTNFP